MSIGCVGMGYKRVDLSSCKTAWDEARLRFERVTTLLADFSSYIKGSLKHYVIVGFPHGQVSFLVTDSYYNGYTLYIVHPIPFL